VRVALWLEELKLAAEALHWKVSKWRTAHTSLARARTCVCVSIVHVPHRADGCMRRDVCWSWGVLQSVPEWKVRHRQREHPGVTTSSSLHRDPDTQRRVGGAAMGKLHEIARNSASAAAARACVNSGVGVDDRVCLQLVWPILLSPFSCARAELLSFLHGCPLP
jgi:hypothetical protein